ncbi:MAG: DUF47 domain-containing protein [Candidatus Thorarchaeota archaeon]
MVYQNNGNNVEKKVFDIMLDHSRIVFNGSEVLARLLDCWKTPGREEFNVNFKQLNELESKANTLKKSALKEITDAGPTLLFRQDLTRIIKGMDQIVDLAQGAAFFIEQLDSDWVPPKNIIKNLEVLSVKMLSTSKLMIDVIRALYQSVDKVIEISEQIEIIENQADANYRALIIDLAKLEAPKGIPVMIRESVDRIENMIDSARDNASNLRTYAMSR